MPKIWGIGPHYKSLLESKGMPKNSKPLLFIKPLTSRIGEGESIVIPRDAEKVMAEVEIAVQVNRMLRNANARELRDLSAISGYAIANDLTAFGEQVFGGGKIYDSFTPLGLFVPVADPSLIHIESYQNGILRQSASALDMGFDFAQILAYFSSVVTIEAGDILLTGTPAGPFEVFHGDQVELRSPQLGTIVNPVIKEEG
jgi:2-keto-4-pentenoate hydratase/2-oxohepta-3-ene-1,7-dioic acid hydratase in catechol pathway